MGKQENCVMHRPRFLLLAVVFLASACVNPLAAAEARILIVGDSWAAGIVGFQAIDRVFDTEGLVGIEARGDSTALGGSRADQWAANQGGKLDALAAALAEHPSIDIVHLSIGGNDFLKYNLENDLGKLSKEERAEKWLAICADIRTIAEFILENRPDAKVLLNDYDFLDPTLMAKTYNMAFKGDPSAPQLNSYQLELGLEKRALAEAIEGLEYIHHFGLMQYHFGIPGVAEAKSLPYPGQAPDYEPYPGGNIEHPSPAEAMPDGVHPVPEGYVHIIANCFAQFYEGWLTAAAVE
jgi:lysophospholipase L1-like esterase